MVHTEQNQHKFAIFQIMTPQSTQSVTRGISHPQPCPQQLKHPCLKLVSCAIPCQTKKARHQSDISCLADTQDKRMPIYNTQKCKIVSQMQNVGYFIRMFISTVQIFKIIRSTEPITREQRRQVFKIDDHLNYMQTASKKR